MKYKQIHQNIMNSVLAIHESHQKDYTEGVCLLLGILEKDMDVESFWSTHPRDAYVITLLLPSKRIPDFFTDAGADYFQKSTDMNEKLEMMRNETKDPKKAAAILADFASSMYLDKLITENQRQWCMLIANIVYTKNAVRTALKLSSLFQECAATGFEISVRLSLGIE